LEISGPFLTFTVSPEARLRDGEGKRRLEERITVASDVEP
jgi:hypothetical protein